MRSHFSVTSAMYTASTQAYGTVVNLCSWEHSGIEPFTLLSPPTPLKPMHKHSVPLTGGWTIPFPKDSISHEF